MQRNTGSGPQGAPESTEMSKEGRPGRKSPVSMARSSGASPGTAVTIVTPPWAPEVCGRNGGFVAFIADLFRDMVGAPPLLRLS